jgi:thiol-disulfide isomerase/thioredoxin
LLPWLEILVAAALLPASSAWYGAVMSFGLLLAFITAIGFNLARGRKPDCHCFGQLHSAPAGWSTLTRNALLAALAGSIVWRGPGGLNPASWISNLTLGESLLCAAGTGLALLGGQSFLLVQVLRQQGRLLARLGALDVAPPAFQSNPVHVTGASSPAGRRVGSPAPGFKLDSLDGGKVALQDLLVEGRRIVILFTNPGCGPCRTLLPEIARWQRELAGLRVVLISEGIASDNEAIANEYGLTQVLVQEKREVAVAYLANGTPAALVVQPDGSIGSPVAFGADAIRALVANTIGIIAGPSPLTLAALNGNNAPRTRASTSAGKPIGLGELVPPIKLAALDGEVVQLSTLRGERTLLLFWNTGCGFCRRMLDDLRTWDANPPRGAPRLVVISSGQIEDIRAMGLRSLVLLVNDHQTASVFGANGTPMAVLLDQEGRVASSVAAGHSAVLTLARSMPATDGGDAIRQAD